jgi:signal transduction histidine kinase
MAEGVESAEARIERLERRLARERMRRHEAERVAESGTRRLYELNRNLDELVVERTREAEDARQAAESALSSRVELLRMIAHEVLTPMHQIQGMLELVDTSRLPDDERDRVLASSDAAAEVAHLVRDVADLVAIETDTLVVSDVACRPAMYLDELARHWRPVAARRGVLLIFDSAVGVDLEIVTDPTRVRRVMDELLLSAVDSATSRVLVRARIDDELHTGAARQLVIEVHDDGLGEVRAPWTMADLLRGDVTADVSAGTVVGLLLAQRLVAALGGSSDLGSSELGGTVRTMVLGADHPQSR